MNIYFKNLKYPFMNVQHFKFIHRPYHCCLLLQFLSAMCPCMPSTFEDRTSAGCVR